MSRNTRTQKPATRARVSNTRSVQQPVVEELTAAEQAGVATHEAICTGATAVKDGAVYVGSAIADGATAAFQFLRRTVTGA